MIDLDLISWNLHGTPTAPRVTPRMRRAAREIRRRAPDVALLQEVWRPVDADLIAADLGPGWTRVETGERTPLGARAGGLVAFVSRARGWRVAHLGFERFEAHAPGWKLWEGDGLAAKGIQTIELRRGDARVALANTHLQASYGPNGYAEIRRAQLRQLRGTLAALDARLPVVAAGDLNTRPEEPIFGELSTAVHDLCEPFRRRCRCGTSTNSDGWIDYVLARRSPRWRARAELELIRSERPDWPYSDHHALCTRVTLEPDAPRRREGALWGPATRRAWLLSLARALLRA